MRKSIALLCCLLLAVQCIVAQHNLYVVSSDRDLQVYESVSKITFDDSLFVFEYGDVTKVTDSSFSTSVKVSFSSVDIKRFGQTLEVGLCCSDLNPNPTIQDGKIRLGTSLSDYTFSINALEAGTIYYYRAYVKVSDAIFYGDVCQESTSGEKPASEYSILNVYKFVDLGLPSGLLWATRNVGAATSADDGDYFAWGETETKSIYFFTTYKYNVGIDDVNYTKYNDTDGKTALDSADDAAYVNWGSFCRMPTNAEFKELRNSSNCTWTWTSKTNSSGSSINGYEVTSVKNGNSIFLPASGRYDYSSVSGNGEAGYYWSSTRDERKSNTDSYRAYRLNFTPKGKGYGSDSYTSGYSVRPVAAP